MVKFQDPTNSLNIKVTYVTDAESNFICNFSHFVSPQQLKNCTLGCLFETYVLKESTKDPLETLSSELQRGDAHVACGTAKDRLRNRFGKE